MRNSLVGVALAAVLVAALFAAAHFWSNPVGVSGPDPAKLAASLPDDYVGQTTVGAWKLVCNPPRDLPAAPKGGMQGNSAGTAPKETPPPPGWKLPRCIAGLVLRNPNDPQDEIRVTFRNVGFKRVLALFLRFPPTDVTNGDMVKVRFDDTEWQIPVRTCPAAFCLAIQSIKFADVPAVEKAKSFTVMFKPASSRTEVAIPVPTNGLTPAIHAMRRLNH